MTAEERRGRIVIVDDDAGGRQAMARALERVGFEVAPFADGIEALAFLREHHCAHMQGYLKAPPLPAEQCLVLLQAQREEVVPAP